MATATSAFVSAAWLHAQLQLHLQAQAAAEQAELHVVPPLVLDASWYLPVANRSSRDEFAAAHIPTAYFFDIDKHANTSLPYPHMLPSGRYIRELLAPHGVTPERASEDERSRTIVVYDASSCFNASVRLWWTLRTLGFTSVRVLDGGFAEWRRLFPADVESGERELLLPPASAVSSTPTADELTSLSDRVWDSQRVLRELERQQAQQQPDDAQRVLFLDARERARFDAQAPEPRPVRESACVCGRYVLDECLRLDDDAVRANAHLLSLDDRAHTSSPTLEQAKRRGHIPGARSIWHASLQTVTTTGRQGLRDAAELRRAFEDVGVVVDAPPSGQPQQQPQRPIVAYCGSGATACVLVLALFELGRRDHVALYDASWCEWGNRDDVPIEE